MLTPKQKELLDFLNVYVETNGYAPSFVEMQQAMDLKSKSGIHRMLSGLEERGFIIRLKDRTRAIKIVPQRIVMTDELLLAECYRRGLISVQ